MNSNFDIPVEKLNEPGNLWIRPQNKQLRYSTDAENAASWLNPLPVYKASKEIKFGQPVSLTNYSQEHSISESGARARTIMPTNALDNSSFIGIAIEYGEEKKEIHILNQGELVYEISKKDNPKYWLPPYHKDGDNFVFDWTDADVGSTVYITSSGSYTLNVDEVSGGNIMSVGKLVFAPKATETKEKQQKIIIHIQAGGDDRGVKDTAQFTVQMSSTIKPTSIESDYDQLIFVKINKDGLGEVIFNDDAITNDIESSPVGAIMVKSEDGLCDLTPIIGKKITLVRMGLISGNFGFNTNNVGKIGLLNDGKVAFKSAKDYNIKVGLFKSYNGDTQDFLVDCRFPMEGAESGDKIGTIKPVFGPSDDPLLDIGYALVDNEIHRTTFIRNDSVDKSGIDWEDLIKNCYTKDIFEFGRKINGKYVFFRVLEDFNGKSWSLDIYDTDETIAILNPETFFKFRNLYYTINSDDGIKQVACQIKYTQDSLNTNEECIWPEEAYKIKLKATSDKEDYVLGGKGPKSTLFCNISRLVAIGNYMDGNGSNIETYDITVKVQSTGQILSPGFYQNKDGKWCGFEWFIYGNNGLTYLYMSTIPSGVDAKDCNGINTTMVGEKLTTLDPEETLIVTVRRRPTLYNAVYLNQYPVNNPWTPYIDGNTGNLITENAIYFGTPSKLLSQNQTGEDDETTSGMEFNEAGRNGKIELTTEDSGKTITLSTQVRGSTNTPTFKDKKQVIKSDGSISNTIEWKYDFANNVTSLNSYFAPILISQDSSKNNTDKINIDYSVNNDLRATSSFEEYLSDMSVSAIEILDTFYFRNIKFKDSSSTKSTISIVVDDDSDKSKFIFSELENDLPSNIYSIDSESLAPYKDYLYVDNRYINYMSLLSLVGMSTKDLYNKVLRLERIIGGADFNKRVDSTYSFDDKGTDYINTIGLLRTSGYLKRSLVLLDTANVDKSLLSNSYLPNNKYASIVDRFVIDNFYNYKDLNELAECYVDFKTKESEDRLNIVKDYTQSVGSNLARLNILYNDLHVKEYSYKTYDYFKYLSSGATKESVSSNNIFEGSTIEADKIVFRKNTSGYQSLCKDGVGYGFDNIKTEKVGTEEVYEICSDDEFDPHETYYENVGNRKFEVKILSKKDYDKNRFYVKRTVQAQYRGYPFRWPLYKDLAFKDLDLEYNFFSKQTYGLDDSLTIYDNNPNKVLSSFSSQSLEGITFDTISKLSFLYSCFDKNHTFESKMTWFLPFVADDGKDYTYELRRLSNTKSISAENDKTYSAFITKDNKIIELGSLYYNAYRFEVFESNAFTSVQDSIINYYSKYSDWRGSLLKDKALETGIKSQKSITIKINLGDNKIYSFDVPDNKETYKKFIFLMTQGKLQRIKNTLDNAYLANKLYGDFFKKDYIKTIDISTNQGLQGAKTSISNYIYSGLSDESLAILAKLSITPAAISSNEEYKQLGSYSTIVSEIKSLRVVDDITLAELRKFFNLVQNFNNPKTGSKDNISGNSSLKAVARLENDLNDYDGYLTSVITKQLNATESKSSISPRCEHNREAIVYNCLQTGEFTSENKFTIYKIQYTSKNYERVFSGCDICKEEGNSLYNRYHNPLKYSSGHLNTTDTSLGSYSISVSPTSLARNEETAFRNSYPLQYALVSQYFSSVGSAGTSFSNINHPEMGNFSILCARCKYALDLGYGINDFLNYLGGENTGSSSSSVKWDDFSLIDYARAAAYGPKNIVFYSESAYKDFTSTLSSVDLNFNFDSILAKKILESNEIVDNYGKASLKVMWPSEINTFGQTQNSITYAKNDINSYLDVKVSDEAGEGDSGIINIKNSSKSRISLRDVNNLPDITVAEFKQFLKGDATICKKCNINPEIIKEYNINVEPLEVATNNWTITNVEFINDVVKSLLELRQLQYDQIESCNNSDIDVPRLSTPVVAVAKEAVTYDLVQQGVSFETALELATATVIKDVNIAGGFVLHPELKTTYGLLDSKFGDIAFNENIAYNSDLIGLSVHTSPKVAQKNINDFKLKELYNYNNIDLMIIASTNVDFNILLDRLDIIKNYIEEFFDHSDKILKDFSQVYKQVPVEIKGTTYIDDFVDSETTNKNFNELKNSLDSIDTTIQKSIPSSITGSDSFTQGLRNALQESINNAKADLTSLISIIRKYITGLSAEDNAILTKIINSHAEVGSFADAFKNSVINTSKEVVNKSSFTLKMDKPSNIEDVKTSKAFNLEKYNSDYDREDTTGLQVEPYTYVEYLPEYGYLHSKPSDDILIEKKVDAKEIGGIVYHNNLKTTVKHNTLIGSPIQNDMFISHRTEVKEGFYLRGEQLPLPMVSLNISPDIQNQSQQLMYKPTYEEYASNYQTIETFPPATLKAIKITGMFPTITIEGQEYSISSISKNIISGGPFDSIPNGLKIVPELEMKVTYGWMAPNELSYDPETGEYLQYDQQWSDFIISLDRGKIYRNYVYHIILTPLNVTNESLKIVSTSTYADVTCNVSGITHYREDDKLMIQRIPLIRADSDVFRKLPFDEDLFEDIILNSDIFIYDAAGSYSVDTSDVLFNVTENPQDRESPTIEKAGNLVSQHVKHISECNFKLNYN